MTVELAWSVDARCIFNQSVHRMNNIDRQCAGSDGFPTYCVPLLTAEPGPDLMTPWTK